MIAKSEIYEQLRRLTSPVDPRFTELVGRFDEEDLCNRRNFEGHLTASGVVVHVPGREVLLVEHRSLGKWLAPGGHTEAGDTSAAAAALREITEETGIPSEKLIPANVSGGVQYCVEVSSHVIPCNEARGEEEHMHHDFRFLFAYFGSREICTDERESSGYEWRSLDDAYVREEIIVRGDVDDLLVSALEDYERRRSDDGKGDYLATPLARYLFRLGMLRAEAGDDMAAEELFGRSVEAFRRTYDDEYETPPSILGALWNLAVIQYFNGHAERAIDTLGQGLEASRGFAALDDYFDRYVDDFTCKIEEYRSATAK